MQRSGEEGRFGYEIYRANTLDIEEVLIDVEGKRYIFLSGWNRSFGCN